MQKFGIIPINIVHQLQMLFDMNIASSKVIQSFLL